MNNDELTLHADGAMGGEGDNAGDAGTPAAEPTTPAPAADGGDDTTTPAPAEGGDNAGDQA